MEIPKIPFFRFYNEHTHILLEHLKLFIVFTENAILSWTFVAYCLPSAIYFIHHIFIYHLLLVVSPQSIVS